MSVDPRALATQAAFDMKKIAASIAGGHAYDKHVRGDRGLSPFARSRDDIRQLVIEVLSDKNTKGYKSHDFTENPLNLEGGGGRYVFYSERRGLMVVVNTKASDSGTIYSMSGKGQFNSFDEMFKVEKIGGAALGRQISQHNNGYMGVVFGIAELSEKRRMVLGRITRVAASCLIAAKVAFTGVPVHDIHEDTAAPNNINVTSYDL